ncbi:MAG TPA: hypothetical protein VGY14_00880 [Methyloceanibacter sp.]|jgi:hypothetical protein|nr:hypothetical protein [Methyloceanibacter sp.]
MKSPVIALALAIAVACAGYAYAEPQPLTRADCAKAGMKWNDSANVCGGGAAAAAAATAPGAAVAPEKEKKAKREKKVVVKKVKTGHGTKTVTTRKKVTHPAHAKKERKRGFFQWLNGKNKQS